VTESASKTTVDVQIAGETYTIRSEASPEHARECAAYLDEALSNIMRQGSLIEIVFDPHANDLGTFQARELSFLFDYLDARTFGAAMARGRPLLALLESVLPPDTSGRARAILLIIN
jgi:hypothetical protein